MRQMNLELLELCGVGALILAGFAIGWLAKLAFEESSEKRVKELITFAVDDFFDALKEKELADEEKQKLKPIEFENCKFSAPIMQANIDVLEDKLSKLGKKLDGKTLVGGKSKSRK